MRALQLAKPGDRLSVLCLGAHSDDIEIGAGATLLGLMERGVQLDVHWCVLSGGRRAGAEARASAADFLAKAACAQIEVMSFRDGFFPEQGEAIKQWFEALKAARRARSDPDPSARRRASGSSPGLPADLEYVPRPSASWNTKSRSGTAISGSPMSTCRFPPRRLQRKIELLIAHFGSQRSKQWFDDETFRGLARIRGMECRAPERYAEAFFARKLCA